MTHPPVDNREHRLCVAPMMAWTDRHCRVFHRQLTRHARLYTEMVTTGAIRHGDRDRLLAFDAAEQPVALQVGGCDPADMALAARVAADYGYAEININVGCPSDRVQHGAFGACLMAEPARVADCVSAMRAAAPLPVTVKTRIGIDHRDDYAFLHAFAGQVADAGCEVLIVHARKAWLSGLSPKANREVPPLDYERVYRLKRDFPALRVVLNGGINTLDQAAIALKQVDGVMIGRAAYQRPWLLAGVDRQLFGERDEPVTRHDAIRALLPYIERAMHDDAELKHVTRHLLGLFHGCPGGRRWRRLLSEQAHRPGAGIDTLLAALAEVPEQSTAEVA
ncbi:tRNA dihydrouridine(20/20a) synthase DusA [Salinisphaera sp. P385]|uniref:tRNA-dihydrouridine(20/20a) synthase n=1 Tax=Spectribacter acetivorans TaxID=3075603 RepID=A0ABU3B3C7_9GAMM|nr:tRNA dihydrouridine(20/20a) synthase DusA [Salinisphaera sp. P385]MDT0616959.1 tRNA dihydrouridine(20/20a) synthase DusA [Salinisphaera sp. P385]